jgi:hypothetical protein
MPLTGSTGTLTTCVLFTVAMAKVAQVGILYLFILFYLFNLKRTHALVGTMVACLLLRMGACATSSEALQLFANRRTGMSC